jgi:hypothetical protein
VTNVSTLKEIARMKTLNQSKRYAASVVPTQSRIEYLRGSIKRILIAAGLAAAVGAPAWAQNTNRVVDPESAAHANWRATMKQVPAPDKGCYHASYPSLVWETVDCTAAAPHTPTHVKPKEGEPEVVGNGGDYVAQATGLISSAAGAFTVSGVKSEKGVGVAAFGGGGILGTNEYSVQLNTNDKMSTSACAGHSGCTVWQQFVYATDYLGAGKAAVFMQYWLLDWGSSACPSGWGKYDSDCYANSPLAPAPDIPIANLGELELATSVQAAGFDSVTLYYGSDVVTMTWFDAMLDIASVWNKAEFNVVGDAGGSQAQFNSGSSIKVILSIYDGFASAPTCLANAGTTGETNNLNLGSCTASVGIFGIPLIEFSDSN